MENNLSDKPEMIAATQAAIQGYAQSIIRSPTEVILALDKTGDRGHEHRGHEAAGRRAARAPEADHGKEHRS